MLRRYTIAVTVVSAAVVGLVVLVVASRSGSKQVSEPDAVSQSGSREPEPTEQNSRRLRSSAQEIEGANPQVATPEPCSSAWVRSRLSELLNSRSSVPGDSVSSRAKRIGEIASCGDAAVEPIVDFARQYPESGPEGSLILGRIASFSAVEGLILLLMNGAIDQSVHEGIACQMLADLRAEQSAHVTSLGEALRECRTARARVCLARLLGRIPDDRSVEALVSALRVEADGSAQAAILRALEALWNHFGLGMGEDELLAVLGELKFTLDDRALNALSILIGQQLAWRDAVKVITTLFVDVMSHKSTESQLGIPANAIAGWVVALEKGGWMAEQELIGVLKETDSYWLKWAILDTIGSCADCSYAALEIEKLVADAHLERSLAGAALQALSVMPGGGDSFYRAAARLMGDATGFDGVQAGQLSRLAMNTVVADATSGDQGGRVIRQLWEMGFQSPVVEALKGRVALLSGPERSKLLAIIDSLTDLESKESQHRKDLIDIRATLH